jgi:2-polyprenyl-3-methyl-5-hydroxy-6-metoxy-1,4-benzoquinol methylase
MENWSNLSDVNNVKFTTPLPDLSELMPILDTDSKVLDLGCGYGRALSYLYEKGFKNLIGVDVSEQLIRRAKNICPSAVYYAQNFKDISLKEKFDLILLMAVIEYIQSDRAQDEFFEKVESLLNDKGYILLETFIYDFKLNLKNYLLGFIRTGHFGKFINSKGIGCHHQSINTLRKILSKRFEIVQEKKEMFITWSGNNCNGYTVILKRKNYGQ